MPYLKGDPKSGKKQPVSKVKPPLTHDDVIDAHEFLERYDGNFRSLLGNTASPPESNSQSK